MKFGEVLFRAWKIIWKHKVLWIFGILASCGQGSGGGGGGGSSSSGIQSSGGNGWNGDIPEGIQQFFFEMEQFFNQVNAGQVIAIVAGVLFVLLLLSFLFMALSTIGRLGLIQGTVQSEEGVERLTFGALFNSGKPFFWRLLGLNFLTRLALFALLMVLLIPLLLMTVSVISVR